MIYSPLRYPGGKNKIAPFIAKVCKENKIDGHYVEPYSGGGAVALFLLMEGFVDRITINDRDRSVYAFWHSVLNKTKSLCELIENTEITISEWRNQREIQNRKKNADLLELGFSTFFLNRTNRSGIILAGPIGGMDQSGDYKIDCRFNKIELIQRIKLIASKKKKIRLYKKDAVKLVEKVQNEALDNNVIFYFDPPYYLKANSLYLNHYKPENHKKVSEIITSIHNINWIVSYDNVPEIRNLYQNCNKKEFEFYHTAYEVREGKEVLFFSSELKTPDMENWDPLRFKYRKKGKGKKLIYIKS